MPALKAVDSASVPLFNHGELTRSGELSRSGELGRGELSRSGELGHSGEVARAGMPLVRDEPQSRLPWAGSGLILVADDNEAVARVTSLVLGQCGFDVALATSGQAALQYIREHAGRLRLALVDLTMPDKTGLDVLQEARASGFESPIVLTSGHPREEADRLFGAAGFSAYIQKPYRLETLVKVLRRALGE